MTNEITNKDLKNKTMEERFEDIWNILSEIVNESGDTEAKVYLKSVIQSEIDNAVEHTRREDVEKEEHERRKLLDGFAHPKNCPNCKQIVA